MARCWRGKSLTPVQVMHAFLVRPGGSAPAVCVVLARSYWLHVSAASTAGAACLAWRASLGRGKVIRDDTHILAAVPVLSEREGGLRGLDVHLGKVARPAAHKIKAPAIVPHVLAQEVEPVNDVFAHILLRACSGWVRSKRVCLEGRWCCEHQPGVFACNHLRTARWRWPAIKHCTQDTWEVAYHQTLHTGNLGGTSSRTHPTRHHHRTHASPPHLPCRSFTRPPHLRPALQTRPAAAVALPAQAAPRTLAHIPGCGQCWARRHNRRLAWGCPAHQTQGCRCRWPSRPMPSCRHTCSTCRPHSVEHIRAHEPNDNCGTSERGMVTAAQSCRFAVCVQVCVCVCACVCVCGVEV